MALIIRVVNVYIFVHFDAIIKGAVAVMNNPHESSIVACYTQPEISDCTTSSQYGLCLYVASVCELPESVVTDTLTTGVRLLKSNGTVSKGDVHCKVDCTS